MTAYERVLAARANGRPSGLAFIEHIFTDFIELKGDRRFGDDPAVVTGLAFLGDRPVTVVALEKGRSIEEKVWRNFGSANPEGYRKALRQMKLAEKFKRPVVCFVDTSGAYCGLGAEERGQGQAIAENILEMTALNTPVLSILIGEGGSGGALGLAVADEVWMLENAVYSVISPEGCASILWKDSTRAAEAAQFLRLTAQDLCEFGVVDAVISEENGDFCAVYEALKAKIADALQAYGAMDKTERLDKRYARFRRLGL